MSGIVSDIFGFAGLTLVAAGLWLIDPAYSFIGLGVGCVLIGVLRRDIRPTDTPQSSGRT